MLGVNYDFKPNHKEYQKIDNLFRERLANSLSYLYEVLCVGNVKIEHVLKDLSEGNPVKTWALSGLNSAIIEKASIEENTDYLWDFFKDIDMEPRDIPEVLTANDLSPPESYLIFKYATIQDSPHKMDNNQALQARENVKTAIELLRAHAPIYYQEMLTLTNGILLIDTDDFESGSTFDLAKLMYIKAEYEPTAASYLTLIQRIVHENAHMLLHLISIEDGLVENKPSDLFSSPFRKDPRPMIGIFHAHFVVFRLIDLMKTTAIYDYFTLKGISCDEQLESLYKSLKQTSEIIGNHAILTDLGRQIFESTRV